MISKKIIEEIDYAIKQIWVNNIQKDYSSYSMLKEDSLKCCLYYHLRRRLSTLLQDNNLRIYPEYYFSQLHYRADIAIVQIVPDSDKEKHLSEMVSDVVAVFELKFINGAAESTESWVKKDIQKFKNYIQSGKLSCQFYFAVIYETECSCLNWLDKRSTNNWAAGHLTELNAGCINEDMIFEVNSYNNLNTND